MMQGAVGLRILCLSVLICLGAVQVQAKGKGKGRGKTSDPTDHQKGQPSPSGHENNSADNAADSLTLVTSANKAFAFNLYRQLANQSDNQGKNVFFSPSSVSLALAALSVGARGQTHQQIFNGLGFNSSALSRADVNQAFRALLTGASSEDISAGTAVFVANKFKPRAKFLQALQQSYLTKGFNVDFTNSTASAATINSYVAEKTNGKINQLVDELDPDTLMYLISYVYYKGKWKTKFNPNNTEEEDFFLDQRTQVPVQMMYLEDKFHVHYDNSISTYVLRLPFDNSYSMILMLPDDEGRGLTNLEGLICPMHYAKWIRAFNQRKKQKYAIRLPKFSIKTNVNLNNVLRQMGITDVFDAAADLSGISEDHSLSVSKVVHQATLDVDETGATAAAVTAAETVLKINDVPELAFDRPFMVLIADRSDNVLFMGKIVNPNL